MEYTILSKRLKPGRLYTGIISSHDADDERLIINVTFDRDRGLDYPLILEVNDSKYSAFGRTIDNLNLLDGFGDADTEKLNGIHVIASIRKRDEEDIEEEDGDEEDISDISDIFIDKLYLDVDYYKKLYETTGKDEMNLFNVYIEDIEYYYYPADKEPEDVVTDTFLYVIQKNINNHSD